jgi:hypothetical protein
MLLPLSASYEIFIRNKTSLDRILRCRAGKPHHPQSDCRTTSPGFTGLLRESTSLAARRRLDMMAQPLFQVRDPAPDGRMIRRQTSLFEQYFDIAQRERVAQIPAHGHTESAPALFAAT